MRMSGATFVASSATHSFDGLFYAGWAALINPPVELVIFTCGQEDNASGYCDPKYDELVHAASTEYDPARRKALIDAAQTHRLGPGILDFPVACAAVRGSVQPASITRCGRTTTSRSTWPSPAPDAGCTGAPHAALRSDPAGTHARSAAWRFPADLHHRPRQRRSGAADGAWRCDRGAEGAAAPLPRAGSSGAGAVRELPVACAARATSVFPTASASVSRA